MSRPSPSPEITGLEVLRVKVTERGNWTFVLLKGGESLTGLGEASHGAGFTPASDADDALIRRAVEHLFPLIRGRSPFDVEAFRVRAWEQAKGQGLLGVTAFSALEQAMWDLAGKALGVPVYNLLGGKVRDRIPVYANINRAVHRRTPEDFATHAARAAEEGFRAVKAAPFDDFPPLDSEPVELERMAELGLRRVEAIRRAIGPEIRLMVDCHSRFDRAVAVSMAKRLEPLDLAWYEEPVDPEKLDDCLAIRKAIRQPMAGGEILFGREGFEPLCRSGAFETIMPDVKHCGGILEAKKIASLAEVFDVEVSPHNPSGPVSLAASAQLAATLPNFSVLEHAWGEVDWQRNLVDPPEQFEGGCLPLSDLPGWGIELNRGLVAQHS